MSETYFSSTAGSKGLSDIEDLAEEFEEETGVELPFEELDGELRYDGASVYAAINDHEGFYRLNGGGQKPEDLAVLAFMGQYMREAGYEEVEVELNGAWKDLRDP